MFLILSFVFRGSIPLSTTKKCVRTLAHFFFCHSLRPSNARRFNSKAHGNRSRESTREQESCALFIKVPSTLCSDASFASFQRLLLYSARHQHASFQASRQTAAGIPTNGSMYSRRTVAGIPAPHTEPGRHVARCSVAVHNEALFILYLYLYLYIYYNIYINIKLFLDIYCYWKTTATLQRCNIL